jgi:ketosteroid isomerase-like protein
MLDTLEKFAIQELLHRYSHCADYEPPDRMREFFTGDARFEVPAMGLHFAGIDAIIGYFHAGQATHKGMKHVISNVLIDGDGDSATSSAYLEILAHREGGMQVVGFGRYQDRLKKGADGRWRFIERKVIE